MTNTNILQQDYTRSTYNHQLKIPMNIDVCIPSNDCLRLIFRTKHFGPSALCLLSQMAEFLHDLGQITQTEVFLDGTKIEANANRYTFVWKKAVTKHQAKLLQKTAAKRYRRPERKLE